MPLAVTAKEFLRALWGQETGVAELTAITPKGVKPTLVRPFAFVYTGMTPESDSVESLLAAAQIHNKHSNVYMGVCLRREQWPQGSRGTEALALSSNVVWMDVDFSDGSHKGKTVDPEKVRKLLKEFPLKPSIIVKSGGGLHVYWLLREPAVGAELVTVKRVNKAVVKYFGGDSSAVDLARVLRIPGTVNHNCTPLAMAEISWWRPDLAYTLMDFDFVPGVDDAPAAGQTFEVPVQKTAAESSNLPQKHWVEETPPPATDTPSGAQEPRPTPTNILDDDVCRMIGKLFAEIWFEGWRHDMALCVSGWLAFSGIKFENAVEIVRIASDIVKGDTAKRLKDVSDTYRRFVAGGEVKGRPSLETMIDEAFPTLAKDKAKKTLEAIQKLMPKPKGSPSRGLVESDFKILWLTKYTSSPPVWTVTLEKEGKKIITKTEHSRFMKYEVFVEDVCDQNTLVPQAALKNPQWRGMINEARRNGLYDEQVAPPESRPSGAIEKGLEEFLSESHHNPDIGILKKFPGNDDEESFFRLETFREFLSEQGRSFTPSQLTEKLKAMGWESRVRRFGKKTPHVWIKSMLKGGGGNGNGNGNGHGAHPGGPAGPAGPAGHNGPGDAAAPPPKVEDLFPVTKEGGDV